MRRESNLRKNSCFSLPVEFHGCEQPQAQSLALFLCSQVLVVSTESIFYDMLKSVNWTFSLARSHTWVSYTTRTPHFHCFACLVFLISYNHQAVSFLSFISFFFSCCFTLMWHLHLVCIFWVCHGILRVRINHYHIATIIMERLWVCICVFFFLFLNSITYMIGSSIFQNLKLPKSRNQIFPKP